MSRTRIFREILELLDENNYHVSECSFEKCGDTYEIGLTVEKKSRKNEDCCGLTEL